MSIVIAGTLPPPIGGVSIHTKRLLHFLEKEGLSPRFIELRPRKNGHFDIWKYVRNIFLLAFGSQNDIIHYQMNNLLEATFISVLCRIRSKLFVYTFHSFRVDYFNRLMRWSFRLCCRTVSCCIAPSKTIQQQLVKRGMDARKIHIISTYLPATKEEYEMYVPDEIKEFCSGEKIVLVANAYKLYRDESGVDVYGLDMCIEACRRIEDIKVLFCMPLVGDEAYYQECCELIHDYNLHGRILIYRNKVSLVSVFGLCDIFVRPTNTDSYGISIEEALSSGLKAIASDVCERTEGTVLFKNRDLDDMINTIEMCLRRETRPYKASNYSDLLNLYCRLH